MRQVYRSYDKRFDRSEFQFSFCPRCGSVLEHMVGGEAITRCVKCGFAQYLNPLPGVSVLVEDQPGKILVGARRHTASKGTVSWCFPCGYIDYREDFLTAAHREVKEETNLDVEIRSIVNVGSNHHSPDKHALVVVLFAVVRDNSESCRPGDDMVDIRWLSRHSRRPPMEFAADKDMFDLWRNGQLMHFPVDARFAIRERGATNGQPV